MADDFDKGQPHAGMTPYRARVTNYRPDYSDFDAPEGMVAVTEISDGSLGFDLTNLLSAFGWDPNKDWVDVSVDYEGEQPSIVIGRVPKDEQPPGDDPSKISNLHTITYSARGGEQFQIPTPERTLDAFDISTEAYRPERDVFLFDVFADPDYADTIILDPIGYASDFVWPNKQFSFPEVDDVIDTVARDTGVDADELAEWIDRIASEVVSPTFPALGVPVEHDPLFLSVNGQRVAVIPTSEVDGNPGLVHALGTFYRIGGPMLEAIWNVHEQTAEQLLTKLHERGIPDDNPINAHGVDAAVIPVTAGGEGGEPGIMSKTLPPITERTMTAVTAGTTSPPELKNWLTDFATEVTNDMVKDSGMRVDREPINVPFTPQSPLPIEYSAVRIHFVEESALAELAKEAGLSDPDMAVQRAHDEQAERILMSLSGLPRDYKTFREDSHAIIVPIEPGDPGDPTQDGNSEETSGSTPDDTTQQTLPDNS